MWWDTRLRDWVDWGRRVRGWSGDTPRNYHNRMVGWLDWCQTEGVRPWRADTRTMERWLATLHHSPAVRNASITALRAWCEWQVHERRMKRNVALDLPRPPARRSIPRSLEPDEVLRVLEAAHGHGPRWGCYASLLAFAGLRRAEACGLRWVDVEGQDTWLRVLGKGGQERMVPVHIDLRAALVRWRSAHADLTWVFPGQNGPMSVATANKAMRAILDAAGLPHATGHWLRHAMARRMVEVGVPLPDVQAVLGHQRIDTTSRYSMARNADAAAAMDRLDWDAV